MENNDVQHLEKLRAYWDEHQAFPSMAKLRQVVDVGSTASVIEMIGRLVEAGHLKRVDGWFAPTKKFLAQPVDCVDVRDVEAIIASRKPSALSLLDYVMPEPARTFFVCVANEGLAAKGIHQDDLLVMHMDLAVQAGDIVATNEGEKLWVSLLTSVNGRKLDVQFSPGVSGTVTRADIEGVAIAMVRRFDRKSEKTAKD